MKIPVKLLCALVLLIGGAAYLYDKPFPDERSAGVFRGNEIAEYHRDYYAKHGKFPGPVGSHPHYPTPRYYGSVLGPDFRTDLYSHLKTADFQVRLYKDGRIKVKATWGRKSDAEKYSNYKRERLEPSITFTEDGRIPPY